MISPEQIAMQEEWDAHHDYMAEVYEAEARAIAEKEEAWEYCQEVDHIFTSLGYPQPDFVDDEALRDEMEPLHPNHPLYVALETFLEE